MASVADPLKPYDYYDAQTKPARRADSDDLLGWLEELGDLADLDLDTNMGGEDDAPPAAAAAAAAAAGGPQLRYAQPQQPQPPNAAQVPHMSAVMLARATQQNAAAQAAAALTAATRGAQQLPGQQQQQQQQQQRQQQQQQQRTTSIELLCQECFGTATPLQAERAAAAAAQAACEAETGSWRMLCRGNLAETALGRARALSAPTFLPTTGRREFVICGTEEAERSFSGKHALVAAEVCVGEGEGDGDGAGEAAPAALGRTFTKALAGPVRHTTRVGDSTVAIAVGGTISLTHGDPWQLELQELPPACAHSDQIREIAASPHEPKALASGGFDCQLLVHDLVVAAPTARHATRSAVGSVAWDPADPALVSWTEDSGLFGLLDVRQQRPVLLFDAQNASLFAHLHVPGGGGGSGSGSSSHVVLGFGNSVLQLLDVRKLAVVCSASASPHLSQVGELKASPFESESFFAFGFGPVAAPSWKLSGSGGGGGGSGAGAAIEFVECLEAGKIGRGGALAPGGVLKSSGVVLPWSSSVGVADSTGCITLFGQRVPNAGAVTAQV